MLLTKIRMAMLVAAIVGIGGGLYGLHAASYASGVSDERARNQDLDNAVRQARDAMLEAAAARIANMEVKHVTIRQQATERIIERPVYRECQHDVDVMRLLNAARGFPDWNPPGESKLPPSSGTE